MLFIPLNRQEILTSTGEFDLPVNKAIYSEVYINMSEVRTIQQCGTLTYLGMSDRVEKVQESVETILYLIQEVETSE